MLIQNARMYSGMLFFIFVIAIDLTSQFGRAGKTSSRRRRFARLSSSRTRGGLKHLTLWAISGKWARIEKCWP
jgi:hypothetical protein